MSHTNTVKVVLNVVYVQSIIAWYNVHHKTGTKITLVIVKYRKWLYLKDIKSRVIS